jgi:lipoyl(octanoyl) transferase
MSAGINAGAAAGAARRVRVHWLGRVAYPAALRLQEKLVAEQIAGSDADDLLILEHDSTYTLGRGTDEADLLGAAEALGVPVYRVGRGGGVTYHGPGQLVAYPIVRLQHSTRGVHAYVRTLEQAACDTCRELGVGPHLRVGETGVWASGGKIASIGIGVRRGVAYHGLALNVATDLEFFAAVVPCRSPGLVLTTVQRELGWAPPLEDVGRIFARSLAARMGLSAELPSGGRAV